MEENDLQSLVEEAPVTLDDLVEEKPLSPISYPEKSIKNRAAMTSLLSDDPNAIIENYQGMVAEGARGNDVLRSGIMNKAVQAEKPKDMSAVISILGDQKATLEQKQAAIKAINSDWGKDSSILVANNSYAQPSKGENLEQEDVRISGADQFRPVIEYNRGVQALKNKHALESKQSSVQSVLDLVEMLVPFSVNKAGVSTLKPLAEELRVRVSTGGAAALPGSLTAELVAAFQRIPDSEKLPIARKVYEIVEGNSGIIFGRDNNFVELIQLKQVIDGDYSTFDKVLDNASGVLDAIGLGSFLRTPKAAIKAAMGARPTYKKPPAGGSWSGNVYEGEVVARSTTNSISPVSPIAVLSDSNPEKARNVYESVVRSAGDEVAQATTGTTRTEAIYSVHIPQPSVASGSTESKLVDPDRNMKVVVGERGTDVLNAAQQKGYLEYSNDEIKRAEAHIFNDIQNIDGITLFDNMVTVGNRDGKITVDAVYGTSEGGFKNAVDAITQARFAFREYGIGNNELSLMKKEGGEYVPISMEDAIKQDGDYIVKVGFDKPINPGDVVKMDDVDVKRNFFDRFPVLRSKKAGTMANTILDNASMLHPLITRSASIDVDRAVILDKKLLAIYDSFALRMKTLDESRQNKVYDYIKEANRNGIEKSVNQLVGDGFNQMEIEAIRDWREGWDTIYHLENSDLVRTLDIQGYKKLENTSGDMLIARPVPKNQNIGQVLDTETGIVRTLSKPEMDDLYNRGGTIASLRRPIDISGQDVEFIMARNSPYEYLRGVRPSDQILEYRKGYYQVQYNAPHFIEEIVKDASGKEKYRRAAGVAGTQEEASQVVNRLAASSGRSVDDFHVRGDIKEMRVDTDAYWDVHSASGRIAQRYRGKRLQDASGNLTAFDSKYMLDPLEAATRAARSISGRIATREAIEVSKERILRQYGEYFPLNQKTQKRDWVEDSNSLVPTKSLSGDPKLADARTSVEYLNYLTRGYENSLDVGFKQVMNAFASMSAHADLVKGEQVFNFLGTTKPASFLKSGVFLNYLALNPLRQVIVQSHQAMRLNGLNPVYFNNPMGMTNDLRIYSFNRISPGMNLSQKDREMIDFVDGSGMLDAVDRSNLIRGAITDMAESYNKISGSIGKAVAATRSIGYDLGEQANLLTTLLVLRDRAIKAGKDTNSLRVRDELYAEARAMTYGMNFAGDMPYNQNFMSLALQFFQVPHKAFVMYTNRNISSVDKLKLGLADTLLWGVPGAAIISKIVGQDALPENPKIREVTLFGIESLAMNATLSQLAGQKVKIDFSGFSPYNTDGFANLAHAITAGGMGEFIQNTPAFALYLKDGSRMQEALGRMFRYTGFIDTQEGHEPETILSVLSGVAEMSSGWSNSLKAKTIYETGKLQDKKGRVLMSDPSWMYAAAKIFGFNSQEEMLKYQAMSSMVTNTKNNKGEWDDWYAGYLRVLSRDQKLNNQDDEYIIKVLGAARLQYKDNFEAQKYISGKLSADIVSGDQKIIRQMLQHAGLLDAGSLAAIKNLTILSPDQESDVKKAERLMEDMRTTIASQSKGNK